MELVQLRLGGIDRINELGFGLLSKRGEARAVVVQELKEPVIAAHRSSLTGFSGLLGLMRPVRRTGFLGPLRSTAPTPWP